jgi:hypothetical protein
MLPQIKANTKSVAGEAQALSNTNSDTDLNKKLTVGSSSPLSKKVNILYLFMLFFDLEMPKI